MAALQASISRALGTPVSEQRLIYASRQLDDRRSLYSSGIKDGSTIRLMLRLRGGGGAAFADVSNTGEPSAHRLWP